MSLRLAALRAPMRYRAASVVRTYTAVYGGAPGTGKWSTSVDPNATESEAAARADQLADSIPKKPDSTLQEATASEAEAEFRSGQPVSDKIKDGVKKVVKDVKQALK